MQALTNYYVIRLLAVLSITLIIASCDKNEDQTSQTAAVEPYQPKQLTLAVLPYISPPHILDAFEPLATFLSEHAGIPIRIKTSIDFEQFVQQVLHHRYDLVISNPYLYLKLHKQGQYEPLVGDTSPFKTVFVTNIENPVQSIDDVRGKRVGMLPVDALAGYVLPLDYLRRQGLEEKKDFTIVEYNTFDLVLTALLDNKIDVGVFWLPYYELLSDKTLNKIRTFATTKQFVIDPYSVRNDLPEEIKEKLRNAFLKLNSDDEKHKAILKRTGARGFTITKDSDFDKMREIANRNGLPY